MFVADNKVNREDGIGRAILQTCFLMIETPPTVFQALHIFTIRFPNIILEIEGILNIIHVLLYNSNEISVWLQDFITMRYLCEASN